MWYLYVENSPLHMLVGCTDKSDPGHNTISLVSPLIPRSRFFILSAGSFKMLIEPFLSIYDDQISLGPKLFEVIEHYCSAFLEKNIVKNKIKADLTPVANPKIKRAKFVYFQYFGNEDSPIYIKECIKGIKYIRKDYATEEYEILDIECEEDPEKISLLSRIFRKGHQIHSKFPFRGDLSFELIEESFTNDKNTLESTNKANKAPRNDEANHIAQENQIDKYKSVAQNPDSTSNDASNEDSTDGVQESDANCQENISKTNNITDSDSQKNSHLNMFTSSFANPDELDKKSNRSFFKRIFNSKNSRKTDSIENTVFYEITPDTKIFFTSEPIETLISQRSNIQKVRTALFKQLSSFKITSTTYPSNFLLLKGSDEVPKSGICQTSCKTLALDYYALNLNDYIANVKTSSNKMTEKLKIVLSDLPKKTVVFYGDTETIETNDLESLIDIIKVYTQFIHVFSTTSAQTTKDVFMKYTEIENVLDNGKYENDMAFHTVKVLPVPVENLKTVIGVFREYPHNLSMRDFKRIFAICSGMRLYHLEKIVSDTFSEIKLQAGDDGRIDVVLKADTVKANIQKFKNKEGRKFRKSGLFGKLIGRMWTKKT